MTAFAREMALGEEMFAGCHHLFEQDFDAHTKEDSTPVTDIDVALQEYVVSRIKKAFPYDGLLAEEAEGGDDTLGTSGRTWAVDPLDGTRNFVRFLPLFCSSIGLFEGRKPLFGAVYVPTTRKIHLSEKVIHNPWEKAFRPKGANWNVVIEGGVFTEQTAKLANYFITHKYTVRFTGSTALSLAWTALGHFDVFIQPYTSLWDYAAGAAIMEKSGGAFFSPLLGEKAPFIIGGYKKAVEDVLPVVQDLIGNLPTEV